MEFGIHALLVLHFLGIGALLSGFFYQLKSFKSGMSVNSGIIHGAWLQLVTGLGMAAMVKPAELNVIIIALKSIVITAIFFIAYTFRKKERTPTWVVPIIALLTTLNITLAIFGPTIND